MISILNSKKKKISSLKSLRSFLDDIPFINYGGCAISAYTMFLFLEKNGKLKKNTKIIYLHFDKDEDDYQNNSKFIVNGDGEAGSCRHAILYHNGKYMDSSISTKNIELWSSWQSPLLNQIAIPQHLTYSFIKKSINCDDWNRQFNRKHIKLIENSTDLELFISLGIVV
jgi:hypothetical protein